jgi:peroxin-2
MPIQPSWQHAWEQAQPALTSIRDTLSSQRGPDPRITRIGQLDSELLDHELVGLLQEPLNKVMNLISVSIPLSWIEPGLKSFRRPGARS